MPYVKKMKKNKYPKLSKTKGMQLRQKASFFGKKKLDDCHNPTLALSLDSALLALLAGMATPVNFKVVSDGSR